MTHWWKILLLAALLAGCAPGRAADAPVQPTLDATATPENTPAARATAPGNRPGGPGISYEENLAINPPAVRNLSAQAQADGILVTWEAPEEVTIEHRWGDEILGYKVYRRTADTRLALLGETQDLRYLDSDAGAGVEYFYTVTALHPRNIESTRADLVSATR